jgi:hypothetical protein
MSFSSFYRLCDAFFDELKPNVYEELELEEQQEKDETKYHFCFDLSSCIIYLVTLFGYERVAIEGNEIKHHAY